MTQPRDIEPPTIRQHRKVARFLWFLAFVIGTGGVLSFVAVRFYMYWKWGI